MATHTNARLRDENFIGDPFSYEMYELGYYYNPYYFNHAASRRALWYPATGGRGYDLSSSIRDQNQSSSISKSRIAVIVAIVLMTCAIIAGIVVAVYFTSILSRGLTLADPCAIIVPRAGWEARETRSVTYMAKPVSIVFIHHTAFDRCFNSITCISEMQKIQNVHMDTNGWDDIAYSYVVGDDGMAYEARGWERVGAHTRGWNNISISIAVMGNFDYVLPTESALQAIKSVLECGVRNRKILSDYKLYGHRDASKLFNSPGHKLYNMIKTWSHYNSVLPERPVN